MATPEARAGAAARDALLRVPLVAAWPELRRVAELAAGLHPQGPSALALRAARAAGGDETDAHPAAAALYALHVAVHLVDDVIDGEVRPPFPAEPGLRANLASALQAASVEVLAEAPPGLRAELAAAVSAAARETAWGQALDAAGAAEEEDYWRIVEAKTPPLFTAALRMGARLGGASRETAEAVAAAGVPLGVLVQLGDDVSDVLGEAVCPDWRRPADNPALRYALEADHPERARFAALLPLVEADPVARGEAKGIVVRSGALAFCVHHMLAAADDARRRVDAAGLADAAPLRAAIDALAAPAAALLAAAAEPAPA